MKRIIKPNDSRYVVLKKLRKFNDFVIVYDMDNREENKLYSSIHDRLHQMQSDGLLEYTRNITGTGNFMLAKCTFKGFDWFSKERRDKVDAICSVLSVIIGLLLIALYFIAENK